MHEMELPPRIAYEIEKAAEKAGVSPAQLATVLLNVAAALYGQRVAWPFAAAVREYLEAGPPGAAQMPAAFAELVERCLREAGESDPAAEEGGGLAVWREVYNPVPYEPPSGGTYMVKEQPVHAYGPPAPGPLARASALGRYAHLRSGSEEFARAKEGEIAFEDQVRR